jgi:TfoX/Sxy family transcriptional regulator of competence genes
MSDDLVLRERLAKILSNRPGIEKKSLFGGNGWILNGNMCVGVYKDFLILRVGPEQAQTLLKSPHAKLMDITGKAMKGWLMVAPEGYADDQKLRHYIQVAIGFVKNLPAKKL